MTLDFDAGRPLLGEQDFRRLIRAITDANAEDEPEWLEWKSSLDLFSKEDLAKLARQIVGMGNRDPGRAMQTIGGLGCIVVGADHTGIAGITRRDPAEIGDVLRPVLGSTGPGWDVNYASVDGRDVLVVLVGAPRAGDPIHAIQSSMGRVVDGDIYVRRPGQVGRADHLDLARLVERANASAPLEISVSYKGSPLVRLAEDSAAVVEAHLETERARLVEIGRESSTKVDEEDARLGPAYAAQRSSRYETYMATYLAELQEVLPAGVRAMAALAAGDRLGFPVTNPTDRHLEALEIAITLIGEVAIVERPEKSVVSMLPKAPSWQDARMDWPAVTYLYPPAGPSPWVQQTRRAQASYLSFVARDDGVVVRAEPFDLRAGSTRTVANRHAVLVLGNDPGPIQARWAATAKNVPGRYHGEFEIDVQSTPLSGAEILRALIADIG